MRGEKKMNLEILKTNSGNVDFINLIKLLDKELEERYGEMQKQYNKINKVDYINDVVIIYKGKIAVACGAFKEFDKDSVELKRMFVLKEYRKQGLAKLVINNLEELAKNKGYKFIVLETGKKQHEAINLYKGIGYTVIQNYGPYIGNLNSVCMKKNLSDMLGGKNKWKRD